MRAARAARKAGAKRVLALVTHGLFMPGAEAALRDPAIDRILVTDSVPAFRLGASDVQEKIDTHCGSAALGRGRSAPACR